MYSNTCIVMSNLKKRHKMKSMLLPHGFRKVGWAMLIPAAVLGVMMASDGFDGMPSYLLPADENSTLRAFLASPTMTCLLNNTAIIGICLGAIFVSCSREKIEDEMIGAIRLECLLAALYTSSALLIVATLTVYGMRFLDVMVYNMFTTVIVFLLLFRLRMRKLKKSTADE